MTQIKHLERKVNQLENDMLFWKKAHITLQEQFIRCKESSKLQVSKSVVCMPLCLKHDIPRPCPICDKGNKYFKGRRIKAIQKANKLK